MWPFKFAMRKRRGLPHMVIYLLSTSPKNGVELMDGVQSITRGWWRPTPGSIYPLLQEMVRLGVIEKREDGRYFLTPKGKADAESSFAPHARGPRTMGDMVEQMHGFVSYMEDVKGTEEGQFEQHRGKLRGLAKRLEELLGEEGKEPDSGK